MLNRGDTSFALNQRGRELGIADIAWASLDLDWIGQIDPSEYDAGIGRRRAQRQIDFFAGVQTNAGCPNGVFQGSLPNHVRFPNTSIELERNASIGHAGLDWVSAGHRCVIMRCDNDTAIRSNIATCFSLATAIVVKLLKFTLQSSNSSQPCPGGGMARIRGISALPCILLSLAAQERGNIEIIQLSINPLAQAVAGGLRAAAGLAIAGMRFSLLHQLDVRDRCFPLT